jgi:hypothetical protein
MHIEIHTCQCANCQQNADHPDQLLHHQINLLLSRLDEQQRRWYVALESIKLGRGGAELMNKITGMDHKTIRRGRQEFQMEMKGRPMERIRLEGGGRQKVEKKRLKSSGS